MLPEEGDAVRADARENYERLLDAARAVIAEEGVEAPLRDIARRAGVVPGTLYRHFPDRGALLGAVLGTRFDELTASAGGLLGVADAGAALTSWVRQCVRFLAVQHGLTETMRAAIHEPGSALHDACTRLRDAGGSLLRRAQEQGSAPPDLRGDDLFDLIAVLGWHAQQPGGQHGEDRFTTMLLQAVLTQDA